MICSAAGIDPANPLKTFSEIIEASKAIVESGAALRHHLATHTWFVEQWMAEQELPWSTTTTAEAQGQLSSTLIQKKCTGFSTGGNSCTDEGLWISRRGRLGSANALFMGQQVAMEITSTSDVTFLTNAGRGWLSYLR